MVKIVRAKCAPKTKSCPRFKFNTYDVPFIADIMENPEYQARAKGRRLKVVWMSPVEYDEAITHGFRAKCKDKDDLCWKRQIRARISQDNLDKIKKLMRTRPFNMPYLEYSHWVDGWHPDEEHIGFSQEGHHRMVAAEQLGAKKIPVVVVFPSRHVEFQKLIPLMSNKVRGELE